MTAQDLVGRLTGASVALRAALAPSLAEAVIEAVDELKRLREESDEALKGIEAARDLCRKVAADRRVVGPIGTHAQQMAWHLSEILSRLQGGAK
jgi:hypothetical protein